ncbi:MAG: hypothetical protein M5Z89_04990 [Olivibacter sp.]|nr:hypothetical protein [Olivibacter sp. UJ_SKK_5.1]
MKTLILILLSLTLMMPSIARSQIYVDVLTAPAMTTYAPIIKREMRNTNDNLNAIQQGQMYLQTQLALANELQNKVLKGLREVSGTVRNALTIRQIYETSSDIISEMQDVVQLASQNPQYSIFAYRSASIFRQRALELYAEVAQIVTEHEANFLDAGERQQLLLRVYRDLRLLYGAAYGINLSMKTAIRSGFWRSLNPFQAWVNQDVRIMKDIIRNAKYL